MTPSRRSALCQEPCICPRGCVTVSRTRDSPAPLAPNLRRLPASRLIARFAVAAMEIALAATSPCYP